MKLFKFAVIGLSLMCYLTVLATEAQCKTVYVSIATGKVTNDGLSWGTAKASVDAGLSAAALGDEVWVAKGTYLERVYLKSGVGLYGGFVGTETTRDQRNFKANSTVLDGSKAGTVVTSPSGSAENTVIDGFVIRNGVSANCGGVYCLASYVTISNNLITDNVSAANGGGIYCSGSANKIVGNTIRSNTGGGVYCYSNSTAASTISNNVISGNRGTLGAGIYCVGPAIVTNNTVTGHGASAIHCMTATVPVTMSNNIVAFNVCGVSSTGNKAPVMRNNCLFNPDGMDCRGWAVGPEDIRKDPMLAGWQYGNFHIQRDSPCRDAGWNDALEIASTDMDGQARRQPADGVIDIGADESDGTVWAVDTATVRVKPNGDDANDGSSWTSAKKTVQAGIDAAALTGGEVWVAKGIYNELITLKTNTYVYGGFAGTETARDARDYKINETILDGGGGRSIVTASAIAFRLAAIDGFTIRNGGAGTSGSGGAIYCSAAGPIIANNNIVGNLANSQGGGIYCSSSCPVICGNRITGNTSRGTAGAIYCSYSPASIYNNVITNNSAVSGSGIYCESSDLIIRNNVISLNTSLNAFSFGSGGTIVCSGSSAPRIVNNTITGSNDFAIYCASSAPPAIANNILAFNQSAVYVSSGTPTFSNNCVYGFSYANALNGGIVADPRLAAWQCGDFHIQPDSPCRDAGLNDAMGIGGNDIDGQPRILPNGGTVDIGADESDGTWWTVNAAIVRVSPDGDDANDGSSWALAKKTIQAGMDVAMRTGGEVWVKSGTYAERLKPNGSVNGADGRPGYAYLYGGFAGTEETRNARDWQANQTILDGGGLGSVVTTFNTSRYLAAVDGFIIRNGKADNGGGIYCDGLTMIANNTITANKATLRGGGIYCSGSQLAPYSPTVVNNKITFNSAQNGGGIACLDSEPTLLNNIIARNTATALGGGGGVYVKTEHPYTGATITISNNCIVGNSGIGICFDRPDSWSGSRAWITNNSIIENTGAAIKSDSSYVLAVSNNILAFNGCGIDDTSRDANSYGLALRNNCFYNPCGYETRSTPAGEGDMRGVDPKLANGWWAGDYRVHILPGSPCRDAGWNDAVGMRRTDIDDQDRRYPSDGTVDIGADEFDGATVWAWIPGSAVVRVSPRGDDRNDGLSWVSAKKTVQAAVDEASKTGGEVWVAAGTYNERITLWHCVSLYGGFAGNENSRDARNRSVNTTILDGSGSGNTVMCIGTDPWPAAIDGFTIYSTWPYYGSGIGIYCANSRVRISNNTITISGMYGVFCLNSSPVISNNRISARNYSFDSAAIYCSASSPMIFGNVIKESYTGIESSNMSVATVTNNTVIENGTGIESNSYSPGTLIVSNNIVAFNTYGIWGVSKSNLRNNNVYNPRFTNYYGTSAGVGDISADPLFVDKTRGNYHIRFDSPCINRGWNDAAGLPAFDMDGQKRIQGETVDIGADEWWASIADAKNAADGSAIGLSGLCVTAALPDFFYVESDDRAVGIRVDKPGHGLQVGSRVDVEGTLSTNADGEHIIAAGSVSAGGNGSVAPVAMTNKALGGGKFGLQGAVWGWVMVRQPDNTYKRVWMASGGLSNIGLLVKTWGKVTYCEAGFFYIDDGSGLDDNSGHKGVKVYGSVPADAVGGMVSVVGICSCEKPSDDPVRVIRTRGTGDITVVGS